MLVAAVALGGAVLARQGPGGSQEPKASTAAACSPRRSSQGPPGIRARPAASRPAVRLSQDLAERIRDLEDLCDEGRGVERLKEAEEPRPLEEHLSKEQALERIKQLEAVAARHRSTRRRWRQLVKAEQIEKKTEHIRDLVAPQVRPACCPCDDRSSCS